MYTATIIQEGDTYVATCVDYDIASQGFSVEDAMSNLREAVQLYLDTLQDLSKNATKPLSVFVTNFSLSPNNASHSFA